MLSGFKPLDTKLLRQIREQTMFQGGLNSDYTANVVGETNQVNFKVCIVSTICRGVLICSSVSTGESLGFEQNLTTTCNSMSSVDVKRLFEAMVLKGCCDLTVHHNIFKFSGNDEETSRLRYFAFSSNLCSI